MDIPLVAQMFVEVVLVDGAWGCKCRALILTVCSICCIDDRTRGTQGPDCKHMVGGVATRNVMSKTQTGCLDA